MYLFACYLSHWFLGIIPESIFNLQVIFFIVAYARARAKTIGEATFPRRLESPLISELRGWDFHGGQILGM
jgi:hypothetical protein